MPITQLRWPPKHPADVLDYSIDWSAHLVNPTDSIAEIEWTVPHGLSEEQRSSSGPIATIWLSGGMAEIDYAIACRLTTTGGRIVQRSVWLYVEAL